MPKDELRLTIHPNAPLLGEEFRAVDGALGALAEARRGWHPRPLIPKLGRATPGLDLDP
ncbi:MAG: hypothetical protein ABIF09_13800 [Gemmatimonadota bacterium]